MAEKKIYVGSNGPYLYEDTEAYEDPDGDFAGETLKAIRSNGDIEFEGTVVAGALAIKDTDGSNILTFDWNEDDSADRTFGITVNAGNRLLAMHGDLDIEAASKVNQDLTTDKDPTFAQINLTPRATGLSATKGGIFFDSDDDSVYVCTSAS